MRVGFTPAPPKPKMPKIIHTMIRVLDPKRSIDFYSRGFGFSETHRLAYPDFTLVWAQPAR